MRIGINALYLLPCKVGGSEVYIRNLVKRLVSEDKDNEYFIFINRESQGIFEQIAPGINIIKCRIRATSRPARILWEQFVLPFQIMRYGIDILLSAGMTAPFFCPATSVLVIYDLQHINQPDNFSKPYLVFLRAFIYLSAKSADGIITISQKVRQDIVKCYKILPQKIAVTYLAIDHNVFRPSDKRDIERIREKYHLPERFMLYSASSLPHKNHERLLLAHKKIKERFKDMKLVLIGARDKGYDVIAEKINKLGLQDDVVFLGWLPFEDIHLLYCASSVFVFPSLHEGFGIPVLEAMGCGVPVVCSGIEPLKEIAGNGALFVDPYNPESIAEGVLSVLEDDRRRIGLIEEGFKRAKEFSWENTALSTGSFLRVTAGWKSKLERATKLNVAIVVAYYAPSWAYGGPPRIVYEFSRKLVQRGHSVTVFTTDAFEKDKRIDTPFSMIEGISVHYLKNYSNYLAWNQKIFWPRGQKKALEDRIGQFDIGFICDLRTMQIAAAYKVFRRYRVPYFVSAYGSLPRGVKIKKFLKYIYDRLWGYNILKNAVKVFAQTDNEKKEYMQLGVKKEKIEWVPLGIEYSDFDNVQIKKGAFREKYAIPPDDKIILFLGRIHILKFTPVFIQAFKNLSDRHPDLKLVIVGRDDGYLDAAKRKLEDKEDRYIFVGPLYDKDKVSAYMDSDVFCLAPSHYEETSTAALEALACGTPVVITEQCDIPGLNESGAGVTVKYEVRELETALEKVLYHHSLGGDVSEKAKNLIKQNYDWGKIINRIEDIFYGATNGSERL